MANDAVLEIPAIGRIKMVIWDLDDTFWKGILTEGGIDYDQRNHQLVIELARRGVVSSICSNNDIERVREILDGRGLWSYFVFPQLLWSRKGQTVANIIELAQLRSANVLFIDDNPANLDEVRSRCEGIATVLPGRLDDIAEHVSRLPVSDPDLKRLAQYKVLEAKAEAQQQASNDGVSPEQFLRGCQITAEIVSGADIPVDRVHEMILRTNQLNFTKQKPSIEELRALIGDPRWSAGCVKVRDRYGDYGVVGFYAVDRQAQPTLAHYLFSCRVLNMGIEAWLYEWIGRPVLPPGVVTNGFETAPVPDWIREQGPAAGEAAAPRRQPVHDWVRKARFRINRFLYRSRLRMPRLRRSLVQVGLPFARRKPIRPPSVRAERRILVRGGCDTFHLGVFLEQQGVQITRGVGEWAQTLESLRFADALDRTPASRVAEALAWSGDQTFDHGSRLFGDFGKMVLSLARDYKAGYYRVRDSDLLLPIPPFDVDLTDEANWADALSWSTRFGLVSGPWQVPIYSADGLRWLKDNCRPVDPDQRRARVLDNVRFCSEQAGPARKLILITGSELRPVDILPMWKGIPDEARLLNEQIKVLVRDLPNVELLAINDIVRDQSLLVDGHPFHYARVVYARMASHMIPTLETSAR